MKQIYSLSLHIFRRDLRLEDNTALHQAMSLSEQVIPCFIFDPRQVGVENHYKSSNALQYMIESLQELDGHLKSFYSRLYVGHGLPHEIIEQLFKKLPIDAVFVNKDYTPFSINRDYEIEKTCINHRRAFHAQHDALLLDPQVFLNKQGKPYRLFTPFYKAALQEVVNKPVLLKKSNYYNKPIHCLSHDIHHELTKKGLFLKQKNPHIAINGGRSHIQKIMHKIDDFVEYQKTHDIPSIMTTHLSAANKFGVCSIREVWHRFVSILGINHPLVRQLYWRDFFTHFAFHSPSVFGRAFDPKYDHIVWSSNKKHFEKWCLGMTGFPLVDAGMRQLNETGFMHNRVRMVVASFLVKDLHIDWRWGERYFAQQLIDYDPAVNNGNWQWCASTGCDAQPYFRIFNPWLQQKKFDPDCLYIKQWAPELQEYNAQAIHNHFKKPLIGYPKPIVDHDVERAIALKMYHQG